jgi:hypothetical protein
MPLSIVLITKNEEANLPRTLESVRWAAAAPHEVIVLDSGSMDRTVEIARSFGAKVFVEDWQGFAAQKNSAIAKATGDWVLSLDADEVVSPELAHSILRVVGAASGLEGARSLSDTMSISFRDRRILRSLVHQSDLSGEPLDPRKTEITGYWLKRKNMFLGHWLRFGGLYPDHKLRLFRRGAGTFADRAVHETLQLNGPTARLAGDLLHYSYPTLEDYLEHMERYSTLAAQQMLAEGRRPLPFLDTVLRPALTFLGRYFFLLGFLDGRAGLTFHYQHSRYIRAKYQKALAARGLPKKKEDASV